MAITQNHVINIQPGVSAPLVIHCSQGDTGTQINLTVVNGDEEFDCSSYACSVHGVRSDGGNWGPITCTVSGSTVCFSLTSAMTAVAGACLAEISVGTVGTANFAMLMENATFENGVTYSNDVSVYQNILNAVQVGLSLAEAAVTNEKNERIAAVTNEKNERIAAVTNEKNERIAAVTNEKNERIYADNSLSSRISQNDARIDNLILSSGNESSAEVIDARLGYDNFTYNTLGSSIRNQFNNVNNILSVVFFAPKVGAYLWCDKVGSGVTKANDGNTCWSETPLLCKNGSTVHCKCQGTNNACITTSSTNDITTSRAKVISTDDTQMVEYTYTLEDDMYVWVSSRSKELIAWVENGTIEELSDKIKKVNPFYVEVRNGSASNPSNDKAVGSKYIIPRMGVDGFKIFTSRPNKEGCIYKYGFATYSINPDVLTLASLENSKDYQTYFQNYTLDSNECYFKDSTLSKGMAISIAEYDTTSNKYVTLRDSDFNDYYVYVTPIENKNENLEYLENEINTESDAVLESETPNSFSFIFATDFHKTNDKLNNNALDNCLKAIENVSNNINSSFICYGGDYIDTPTKADGLQDLRYFGKSRNNRPFYKMVGNHDSNPYSVDGTSGAISTSEIYVRLNKNNNYIKVDEKQPYNNYGYYDDETNKVRYICLNISDNPDTDGFGMTDRQFAWFAETLINVGSKDGWCIIVLSHNKVSYLNWIMQAYHNGEEKTIDGTKYNFNIGNKAPIVAFIYGHVHADTSGYFVEESATLNILGIATTCSAPYDINRSKGDDGVVYSAIPGTKDETSFSIFTIDKTNKKIYETKYGNGMKNRKWDWSY